MSDSEIKERRMYVGIRPLKSFPRLWLFSTSNPRLGAFSDGYRRTPRDDAIKDGAIQ